MWSELMVGLQYQVCTSFVQWSAAVVREKDPLDQSAGEREEKIFSYRIKMKLVITLTAKLTAWLASCFLPVL